MKSIEKIGKEVSNKLIKLKGIKAIAFYGSIATGTADKYSDIDLVCLCSEVPLEKERTRLFPEKGNVKRFKPIRGFQAIEPKIEHHKHDALIYKNVEISIMYYSLRRFKKRIGAIKFRGYIVPDDGRVVNYILTPKIIYDPNKLFSKYKKEISYYAKRMKIIIKPLWLKIYRSFVKRKGQSFKNLVKRKNKIWINKQMQIYLNYYLVCLYLLNDKLYFPFSSKHAYKVLKTFKLKPNNCIIRLEDVSITGCWGKDLDKKIKLFSELIKDTDPFIEKKFKVRI